MAVHAAADGQAPLALDELKGYRFDLVKAMLLREEADMLAMSCAYLITRGLGFAQYDAHRKFKAI